MEVIFNTLLSIIVHECSMWKEISHRLQNTPSRLEVAKTMVQLGLGVKENGRIYCGPIELSETKIARAIGVDRRVVRETARFIIGDKELKPIFMNLTPAGPFLGSAAKSLGYEVIEIQADSEKAGILAECASVIAKEGVSIRQVVADDPDLCPEPKLTIITEKEVTGNALQLLLRINGVHKVSVGE